LGSSGGLIIIISGEVALVLSLAVGFRFRHFHDGSCQRGGVALPIKLASTNGFQDFGLTTGVGGHYRHTTLKGFDGYPAKGFTDRAHQKEVVLPEKFGRLVDRGEYLHLRF